MKGIVFTEFLEMVEATQGADMVDAIIADAAPSNGGAYTAVGTYPHQEMSRLVLALSRHSNVPPASLLRTFGEHLFTRFVVLYPNLFADPTDAFGFIDGLESVIHAEVKKLYPDAELPNLQTLTRSADRMELLYRSSRHLEDLAAGLLHSCVRHFGERIDVSAETLGSGDESSVKFVLTRVN